MEQSDSSNESVPGLPSGASGILVRIVLRAIEKSGHSRLAKTIRESPDIIGDKIGLVLRPLFGKADNGELLTKEDVKTLETVLVENPKEATHLLGAALSSALESVAGSGNETQRILNSYSATLNTICDVMTQANTSLALRGFIHGNDCISYWQLKGRHPHFLTASNYIYPNDLDVYLLWKYDPSPEILADLNERIRRSDRRRLNPAECESEADDAVGVVREVHELSLRVRRLNPDRESLKQTERPDIFDRPGCGSKYDRPMDLDYEIPTGAPGLIDMFDSLFEALETQGRHLDLLCETEEAIALKKSRLSQPK